MALVGTLFGGVGMKMVEYWLGRAKERAAERAAENASVRDALRQELESLRAQLAKSDEEERRLEALVDEWRAKYWDLRDENQKVVSELYVTIQRLKDLEASLDKMRPE